MVSMQSGKGAVVSLRGRSRYLKRERLLEKTYHASRRAVLEA